MISKKIERFQKNGFKPYIGKEINYNDICGEMSLLESQGMTLIPDQYIDFLLNVGNGFAWNGNVFHGVYESFLPDSNYTILSLLDYNKKWSDYKEFKNKLVLGFCDDDLYVYNAEEKVYEVVDRVGKDALVTYITFEELFLKEV